MSEATLAAEQFDATKRTSAKKRTVHPTAEKGAKRRLENVPSHHHPIFLYSINDDGNRFYYGVKEPKLMMLADVIIFKNFYKMKRNETTRQEDIEDLFYAIDFLLLTPCREEIYDEAERQEREEISRFHYTRIIGTKFDADKHAEWITYGDVATFKRAHPTAHTCFVNHFY